MAERTPDGYEIQACRSCGAAIIWATTTGGKSMPVDAEPAPDGKGNVELASGSPGRAPVASVLTGPSLLGGILRTSHFATCRDADRWRTASRGGGRRG